MRPAPRTVPPARSSEAERAGSPRPGTPPAPVVHGHRGLQTPARWREQRSPRWPGHGRRGWPARAWRRSRTGGCTRGPPTPRRRPGAAGRSRAGDRPAPRRTVPAPCAGSPRRTRTRPARTPVLPATASSSAASPAAVRPARPRVSPSVAWTSTARPAPSRRGRAAAPREGPRWPRTRGRRPAVRSPWPGARSMPFGRQGAGRAVGSPAPRRLSVGTGQGEQAARGPRPAPRRGGDRDQPGPVLVGHRGRHRCPAPDQSMARDDMTMREIMIGEIRSMQRTTTRAAGVAWGRDEEATGIRRAGPAGYDPPRTRGRAGTEDPGTRSRRVS